MLSEESTGRDGIANFRRKPKDGVLGGLMDGRIGTLFRYFVGGVTAMVVR